jgi:SAM-dependent methyltransferase
VTLFEGTAEWYVRYRPRYPPELMERLAAAAGLDGTGRLLDLGSGPGFIAAALAPFVEEAVACDIDAEMLRHVPAGIRTVHARAEDVHESWGAFRLVTIGRAFHWMDGARVLERLTRVTRRVALVGDWAEQSEAQTIVREVAEELFGPRPAMKQPHVRYADALRASPFSDVSVISVEEERTWTPDELIGLAYSTSFASLARLGARREVFERELRARLKPVYRERIASDAVLGRRSGGGGDE